MSKTILENLLAYTQLMSAFQDCWCPSYTYSLLLPKSIKYKVAFRLSCPSAVVPSAVFEMLVKRLAFLGPNASSYIVIDSSMLECFWHQGTCATHYSKFSNDWPEKERYFCWNDAMYSEKYLWLRPIVKISTSYFIFESFPWIPVNFN